MFRNIVTATALGISLLSNMDSAIAQKSVDTVRFPLSEAAFTMDQYAIDVRGAFQQIWPPSVYDNLLAYDPEKREFIGHLATSWSQPNPTTYELELRTDVKFHDGQPLTADDFVYTMSYLTDPKNNLRFKSTWGWVASVEKLGPHKVRVTAKEPVPGGLMFFAYAWVVYPKHVHEALADKTQFGMRPVGTGPYRVVKLDKNSGITGERFSDYKPTRLKPAASISRVISEPILDPGTRVAALLTDRADVVLDLAIGQSEDLKASGRFDVSFSPPTLYYHFLGFPTKGAQRVKALGDIRVRTAILKAIDRQVLLRVQYGSLIDGELAPALCFEEELGCGYSRKHPEYDLAGARRLLAEAGYPDGFELTISCFPTGVQQATALSGMLQKIGIRASVAPHQVALRRQMLDQGKVDLNYYSFSGNMFDVAPHLDRHFFTEEFDDPLLVKMAQESLSIMDDKARRQKVAEVFDYSLEQVYAVPMVTYRKNYVHTKDLKIRLPQNVRMVEVNPHDFAWK